MTVEVRSGPVWVDREHLRRLGGTNHQCRARRIVFQSPSALRTTRLALEATDQRRDA